MLTAEGRQQTLATLQREGKLLASILCPLLVV